MKKFNFGTLMMAVLLPLAVTFSSCKEDPKPTAPRISINDAEADATVSQFTATANGEAAAHTIKLVTNTSWSVENIPAWITLSQTSGSATSDAGIDIKIYPNSENTGTARQGTMAFRVSSAGVTVRRNVTVSQAAPVGTGATSVVMDWESGTDYSPAAIEGWFDGRVSGDRDWQTRAFDNNKYAQATAHNAGTVNDDYEYWLISPALDITGATIKTATFDLRGGYFQATSSLEVYIMDGNTPGSNKVLQSSVHIPTAADIVSGEYTPWINTSVDLSSFSGVKHIGFRYKAKGGSSNSATYQLDNFAFGVAGLPVSFGAPTLTGVFMVGSAINANINIPYQHGNGETYNVSVSVSGTGAEGILPVNGQSVTLDQGQGTLSIPLTGQPTTEGTFVLTISGITGLTPNTVNGTVQPASATPNLAANNSFETLEDGKPVSWTFDAAVSGVEVWTLVTTGAQDGNNAVKLSGLGGTKNMSQVIDGITPGRKYRVSFWYNENTKGTSTQNNQGVRIWSNFQTASNTNITPAEGEGKEELQPTVVFEPVTTWTEYSVDVTAPADAAKFLLRVRATNNQSGVFDNFSFSEIE